MHVEFVVFSRETRSGLADEALLAVAAAQLLNTSSVWQRARGQQWSTEVGGG